MSRRPLCGLFLVAFCLAQDTFESEWKTGLSLVKSGRRVEAIRQLRLTQKLRGNHVGLLTLLGVLYLQEGYPLDSAETLEAARKQAPLAEKPSLLLAEAWHDSFRFDEALRVASDAAARFPQSPDAQFRLGFELESAGRFEDAEHAFERAIGLRADFPEARLALGRANLRAGRNEQARTHLQAVLRAQPNHRQARSELAKALVNLKEFQSARDLLHALIAESDTDPGQHFLLARIYRAEGNAAGSESERVRFLELSRAVSDGGMSANLPVRKLRRFVP